MRQDARTCRMKPKTPATSAPAAADPTTTTTSDVSSCQRMRLTVMGSAFCTAKTATARANNSAMMSSSCTVKSPRRGSWHRLALRSKRAASLPSPSEAPRAQDADDEPQAQEGGHDEAQYPQHRHAPHGGPRVGLQDDGRAQD